MGLEPIVALASPSLFCADEALELFEIALVLVAEPCRFDDELTRGVFVVAALEASRELGCVLAAVGERDELAGVLVGDFPEESVGENLRHFLKTCAHESHW